MVQRRSKSLQVDATVILESLVVMGYGKTQAMEGAPWGLLCFISAGARPVKASLAATQRSDENMKEARGSGE